MRVTVDLMRRLEAAEAASWANWWDGLAPDSQLGLVPATERIAGVWCARGTAQGMTIFNRATGLGLYEPATAETITQIAAFFRPCAGWLLDLNPYTPDADQIAHLLHRSGMRPVSHQNILAALSRAVPPPAAFPGVEVVAVTPRWLDGMINVNVGGYEMEPGEVPLFIPAAAHLITRPGVTTYLALVDGEPAAVGELHVAGAVGWLTGAATLPEYRGRGLQKLLVATRAAEARRLGCDLLGVQTGIGTQSQWNQEALGFSLLCTRTAWSPA